MTKIVELPKEKRKDLLPLLKDLADDSLVTAVLTGDHGQVYVDKDDHPQVCQLVVGDFMFFAGEAESPAAPSLVKNIPDWVIAVPQNKKWEELFFQLHQRHVTKTKRYSFSPAKIEEKQLDRWIKTLPEEFQIKKINHHLAEEILKQSWAADLVSNFNSIEDYLTRGAGFCVLHQDKIVAGASAYAVFPGGLEVEIDTQPDYRRRGLATAVGARLIKYCLNNDITPHWDAENEYSIKIAERFGFSKEKDYTALIINYY